ncbi:MATE family efflux transporter [uncultured Dubosiella sp.]|uniref:MATE family efflux transporter n=1 Tax=uncultured Dubosiella sp. TaxID=1937011 RepID=UPI002730AC83|nr:MATE family efflux transporter [uncultured Dubosiella sp.]
MSKMESMGIRRLVISMSVPIALSMLVSALYNIVDSIFVAGYSQDALLAVSLCYPVQTLMIAVACGTGVGFNTLLARYLGQNNGKMADQSVMHGLLLALLNWLVFALAGWFGAKAFMQSFAGDQAVIASGVSYIRICTLFSFGIFVQITFERIMQAAGRPMYNMAIQCIGALVNIILDPILIFGLLHFPALGVAGAAIATVIGQIIAMGIGIYITHRKVPEVHMDIRNFALDTMMLKEIYKVGVPAMVMQAVTGFMGILMNYILAPFSDMAVSVFGVYTKLQQFVFMAVMGISNAIIPILAFNYGARRKDRIFPAVRFSLQIACAIMLLGTIVFLAFPAQLLSMFNADASMYEIGIPCLREISLSFVFAGISMILCSCFQALRKPVESLIVSLLRQLIVLIPLLALMMNLFGLQIGWYAFLLTEGACALLSLFLWKRIRDHLTFE